MISFVFIILVFIASLYLIHTRTGKVQKFHQDLRDPMFLVMTGITVVSIFGIRYYAKYLKDTGDPEKQKEAEHILSGLTHAIIALVTAYLSHLDFIHSAFIIVLIFAYYLHKTS